jgi:lipopolysaccharide/colanic/teichoic acid biosynthesis glycosyltransferase
MAQIKGRFLLPKRVAVGGLSSSGQSGRKWHLSHRSTAGFQVTHPGYCLRPTNLNQLPQSLDALNGSMSLVALRPREVANTQTKLGT